MSRRMPAIFGDKAVDAEDGLEKEENPEDRHFWHVAGPTGHGLLAYEVVVARHTSFFDHMSQIVSGDRLDERSAPLSFDSTFLRENSSF
jgi:hypothetical protein